MHPVVVNGPVVDGPDPVNWNRVVVVAVALGAVVPPGPKRSSRYRRLKKTAQPVATQQA